MRRKSEGQTGLVRFATHVVGDGEGYFRELAKMHLEGWWLSVADSVYAALST